MTLAGRTRELEQDMSRRWMTRGSDFDLCGDPTVRVAMRRHRGLDPRPAYYGGTAMAVVDQVETEIQLSMFPTPEHSVDLVDNTSLDDLREFTIAIMEIVIDLARRTRDLDVIRLLNGLIASLEETIAAGDDLDEILSRRRYVEGHALA